MKRRDPIALFAGEIFATPFVARAQHINKIFRVAAFPDFFQPALGGLLADMRALAGENLVLRLPAAVSSLVMARDETFRLVTYANALSNFSKGG
jgi:hypothetical protein